MARAVLESPWLLTHASLLPTRGLALDVACGRGRHAVWLARRGLSVTAIDRDDAAIRDLRTVVAAEHLDVTVTGRDLEGGAVSLGEEAYDVVVVVHYLHRPLFPALLQALRPGGLLLYETFTWQQATIGRPTNPDFLLQSGELGRLVKPLEIVAAREGLHEGRFVASVVARRPPAVSPA